MGCSLLTQVQIKNYKSLGATVVDLGPFTVLVGPNGSGKSNFVDALRFVSECLVTSIALALQNRGGINAVRRHSRGHPTNFGFRLFIDFAGGEQAEYSFEVGARPEGKFTVIEERCVFRPELMGQEHSYDIRNGEFVREVPGIRPRIEPDHLALSVISAVPEFAPVYDFLANMRFYALAPDRIRHLQEPDAGEVLSQDGRNAAAVLREIQRRSIDNHERLCRLLAKVVPGISYAEYLSVGPGETVRFKQDVGDKAPWNFNALNMSDGTLRVLGILLAVYQVSSPSFLAIEEPEATIHPAALDVVIDILKEGASRFQLLLTTHSPDILDNRKVKDDELRVVQSDKGKTTISSLGLLSRNVIRDRLYSAGELLRMQELEPNAEEARNKESQLNLFGSSLRVASR